MAKPEPPTLTAFRAAWIGGRLEHLRALEALEQARDAAFRVICGHPAPAHPDALEHALEAVALTIERAERLLKEVDARLSEQFDRFCGLAPQVAVPEGA